MPMNALPPAFKSADTDEGESISIDGVQALVAAILRRAVNDAKGLVGTERILSREMTTAEAVFWLSGHGDDAWWYETCCHMVNLDPTIIQRWLKKREA